MSAKLIREINGYTDYEARIFAAAHDRLSPTLVDLGWLPNLQPMHHRKIGAQLLSRVCPDYRIQRKGGVWEIRLPGVRYALKGTLNGVLWRAALAVASLPPSSSPSSSSSLEELEGVAA